MNTVYYFSAAGHSLDIAKLMSESINASLVSIDNGIITNDEIAIVVFPVYNQNIPKIVKDFMPKLTAAMIIIIASYGGFSPGNVLYEASKIVSGRIIAAAAVPTGHSLLFEPPTRNIDFIDLIINKIYNPSTVLVKKLYKNPFSNFFPTFRSRIGIKILKTVACDGCNVCGKHCTNNAIKNGIINKKCTRCLRCATFCPNRALKIHLSVFLKKYLNMNRQNRLYLFL